MSWWDSAGLTNLAQNAIKSAQKKIDKVLDIGDEEKHNTTSAATTTSTPSATAPDSPVKEASSPAQKSAEDDSFFNTYFTGDSPSSKSPKTPTLPGAILAGSPTPEGGSSKRTTGVRSKPRTLLSASRSSSSTVTTFRSDSEASASESEQTLRTSGSTSSIVSESGSSSDSQASIIKSPSDDSPEELEPLSPRSTVAKKGAPLKLISRTSVKRKESDLKEGSSTDVKSIDLAKVGGKSVKSVPSGGSLSSNRSEVVPPGSDSLALADVQISSEDVTPPKPPVRTPSQEPANIATPAVDEDPFGALSEETHSTTVGRPSEQRESSSTTETGPSNVCPTSASAGSLSENVADESLKVGSIVEQDVVAEDVPVVATPQTESDVVKDEDKLHIPNNDDTSSATVISEPTMYDSGAWSDSRLPDMGDSGAWGDSQLPEFDDSELLEEEVKTEVKAEALVTEHDKSPDSVSVEANISIDDSSEVSSVSDLPEVHEATAPWGDTSLPEIPEVEEDLSLTPQQEVVPSFPPAEEDVLPSVGAEQQRSVESMSDELSESNRTLTSDDFTDGSKVEVPESSTEVKNSTAEDAAGTVIENEPEAESPEQSKVTEESSAAADATVHQGGAQAAETSDTMTVSSSSSIIVKTMLEDAMTESLKDTDTHSCGSSDKSSEMVRIESGLNSGHTSGDEIDTTTSSDIEIISTPTPNGSDRDRIERPFDLSPLRHALSRTVRRGSPPGHKRSDSSSSGQSTWSKNGDDMIGSPDGTLHVHSGDHETGGDGGHLYQASHSGLHYHHRHQRTSESEQQSANPLETEKLLKKLAEMAEVLEAREKKLLDLSRENIDLHEGNTILRNQLQQSEEAHETEMTDLNALTEEFADRISESEKKLHSSAKEREHLKKQLQETEGILARRSDSSNATEKLMQEKDQQISELLEEGEKLSKQQLQSNNIIKKLRAKKKKVPTATLR